MVHVRHDEDPIPDDVRELLLRSFEGASEVEALLVLVREQGSWTPAALGRRLVMSEPHALALLTSLTRSGLVAETEGSYAFAPVRDDDRAAVEALATLYGPYRRRIISIIFSKS